MNIINRRHIGSLVPFCASMSHFNLLQHIKEKLRFPVDLYPKISVRLCCFKIASDSNLEPKDLQAAKISQTHDVGQWLVELFRSEQEDLADNLEQFLKVH